MDRSESRARFAGGDVGWIDVSRPLRDTTPVWQGDRSFVLTQARKAGFVLSSFRTTCHAGTHVDAPMHLDAAAHDVDNIPIDRWVGPAEVVRVGGPGREVTPSDLPEGWAPTTERVLLRTDSHALDAPIEPGFCALSVVLVHWLADREVTLVGIDTPSVDLFESQELPAHRALIERGLTWIEGLWLGEVEPGPYLLAALPLRLEGAEAAPLRAILRPLGEV